MSKQELESDYIVVGAGSAGSVVAARLAEAGFKVLLLEAGPRDRNPWIHIPLGFGKLFDNPSIIWPYEVEGGPGLENRRIAQPRGRVLGGTGSINGMTYIRGEPTIYDRWAAAGAQGWCYDDVLPYFRKAEANNRLSSGAHSSTGMIQVSDPQPHPLMDRFITAAGELGYARNEDFNTNSAEGAGYFQFNYANGRRSSSATAYLSTRNSFLQIMTDTVAQRIIFEGQRAVAVEALVRGQKRVFRARAEIIISAGSFATPQLLQLSGIGAGGLLQSLGIDVVANVAEVGRNYQDHFESRIVVECTMPITLNDIYNSLPRRILMGIQYLLSRTGPMAGGGVLGGGFFRLNPDSQVADCQVNFGLWSTSRGLGDPKAPLLDPFSAFRLTVVDLTPEARGSVQIVSPRSVDAPRICAPFLQTKRDQLAIIQAMKLARTLVSAPSLSQFAHREAVPGLQAVSDADLLSYARQFGRPNFHAVGTCRMGSDGGAVVSPNLCVRGVEGLRVADGSIMPIIPNGNTNAACTMIGEKAAAMIITEMKR